MTNVQFVDDCIEQYVKWYHKKYGYYPDGVMAKTLAAFGKVTTGEMSLLLQEHRSSPSKRRYHLGCEGYGPNARWKILARPGTDLKVLRVARKEHAKYCARDAVTRVVSDYCHEILPSLDRYSTAADGQIKTLTKFVVTTFEATLNLVDTQLDAIPV